MAIGAQRGDVLRMVLGGGMKLSAHRRRHRPRSPRCARAPGHDDAVRRRRRSIRRATPRRPRCCSRSRCWPATSRRGARPRSIRSSRCARTSRDGVRAVSLHGHPDDLRRHEPAGHGALGEDGEAVLTRRQAVDDQAVARFEELISTTLWPSPPASGRIYFSRWPSPSSASPPTARATSSCASCRRQGCRVLLLTEEKLRDADWPRDAIDEFYYIRRDMPADDIRKGAAHLARTERIDRIVALDDFDVELAAMLREYLLVPGMGETTARAFRDKLAMRRRARSAGHRLPGVRAHPEPRGDSRVDRRASRRRGSSSRGRRPRRSASRRCDRPTSCGSALDVARRHPRRLPARAVRRRRRLSRRLDRLRAARALRGRQPLRHAAVRRRARGRHLRHADAADARSARAARWWRLNARVLDVVRPACAACRTPSSSARATAAAFPRDLGARRRRLHRRRRRGGDRHQPVARVGAAGDRRRGRRLRSAAAAAIDRGGIVLSLARQEAPDMSGYTDPEIVVRIRKAHHAGLIVASPDADRVRQLLAGYTAALLRRLPRLGAAARSADRMSADRPPLAARARRASARRSAATSATSTSSCRRSYARSRRRYPVVYMQDGQNLADPASRVCRHVGAGADDRGAGRARHRGDRRRHPQHGRSAHPRIHAVRRCPAPAAATATPTWRSWSGRSSRSSIAGSAPGRSARPPAYSDRRSAG